MEIVKTVSREEHFRETERIKKLLKALKCPFCGSKELVSIKFQGTFCMKCNSRIEITPTTEKGYSIEVDPGSFWTFREKDCNFEDPQEVGPLWVTIKDHYYFGAHHPKKRDPIKIIWRDKDLEKQKTQEIPRPL